MIPDDQALQSRADEAGLRGHLALAAEVRALLHAMAETTGDDQLLSKALEAVRLARTSIDAGPKAAGHLRSVEGVLTGLGRLSELGPFTGRLHAPAAPTRVILSENRAEAWATYGPAHQGAPGIVHGGIIGGTFDEMLGVVQRGALRMTAELKITYRAPARLGRELRYSTWLDRTEGRKAFVAGRLHDGEAICAEASAVFVTPRQAPYESPSAGRDLMS